MINHGIPSNILNKGFISNATLAILGLLVAIFGILFNILTQWNATLELMIGRPQNVAVVFEKKTKKATHKIELPFYIRLDSMNPERMTPEYRIAVLKGANLEPAIGKINGETVGVSRRPTVVKEFGLKLDKIQKIPDSKFLFRLNEFYPNFGFAYDYPITTDTIEPVDPGIMVKLVIGSENPQLQLRTNQNNLIEEPHIGATLEFYWELPPDLVDMSKTQREIAGDSTLQRIIFHGRGQEVIYLYDKGVIRQQLYRNKKYIIPGKKELGFSHQFIFPDAKYIQATPSSFDQELVNPVAKIEIWSKDQIGSEFAYIYPGKRGVGGFYTIKDSKCTIHLKTDEFSPVWNYSSHLTILNPDIEEIRKLNITIDQSASFGDYRLSALSSFNKSNVYPGITIRPLLNWWIIGIGLTLITFSCLRIYKKSGLLRKK